MLQRIVVCAVALWLVSCGSITRDRELKVNELEVRELISIGDDIFEARNILEEHGFKISYGPKFPTDSRSYYQMIIDYGLHPTGWEKMKLAAGRPGVNKPIWGEVRADPSGRITSIR
ncbi:hypothetical protein [Sulfuriroseicoccus oceanibius]|uniref:Lipoprotein n=1 Tax=Sulfuriroseicoccus oceanibius TaxID=2707525 RepID=A0A6B3L4D3_9BACT|nr:hypothetical protein [Sulfuriroseicoccus oceanibius]QQL45579.1 hypothetical protein G3M56_003040 [Sulfuriroseicoccus oceanibius]